MFTITAKKPIDVLAWTSEWTGIDGAGPDAPRVPSVINKQNSFSLAPGESRGGFEFFERVRSFSGSQIQDWLPQSIDPTHQGVDANWGSIQKEASDEFDA